MRNKLFKNLTVGQLLNAAEKHDYLLCRFPSGYQIGINSKVAKIAAKTGACDNLSLETEFVSYKPCSFMEYINHKHAFI